METFSIVTSKENLDDRLSKLVSFSPSFAFVFASPSFFTDAESLEKMKKAFSEVPIIGCSTAGEICQQEIHKDRLVITGGRFHDAKVKLVSTRVIGAEASYDAGVDIAAQLKAEDLKGIFILLPGLNVNGSAVVKGVFDTVGAEVTVTGGMAGDDDNFQQTFTIIHGDVYADRVVAVGFYGENVEISCGADGGWQPFGPARRVTKSDGHVLYELDGKPALQLYKEYLGDKAKNLPAAGLHYPFAILNENRGRTGIIRSALDVDHEKGALIMAGDVPQDCMVCLMHAESEFLTEGARNAAETAYKANKYSEGNGLVIAVSCIGRRLVMNLDAEDETEIIFSSFHGNISLGGFYSYGEIGPFIEREEPMLHNQTISITYITERDRA